MTEKHDSKKIKLEFDESFLWKAGTVVFGILFIIAILTKGFSGDCETKDNAPSIQDIQQPTFYSDKDIKEIKTFISCLKEKNFHIYGANWCGWTKKLVIDTLGGFDIADPIYTECTEEQELCTKEGIKGFPTIKVNGEPYQGQRTFGDFAKATDCKAPKIGA